MTIPNVQAAARYGTGYAGPEDLPSAWAEELVSSRGTSVGRSGAVSEATGSGGLKAAVPPGAAEPSVITIEHRGIEHVPQESRWGSPSGLLWMWAGAVWNVEVVVYGGLAAGESGLAFAPAVGIILGGSRLYVRTGLAT